MLEHLLLIETPEGPLGPVDFRALGVREFGTIYEGLLVSELSVADIDLAVDAKGSYVPHRGRQAVEVPRGTIYIHDRSGSRKSSGSYFTKSFAVEHLLDRALEPALDDHLKRLDALSEADATEALFDFRVADIAMGSGHFLVAAIDRIERRIADYLNRRPLPGVQRELANLRAPCHRGRRSSVGRLGEDGGRGGQPGQEHGGHGVELADMVGNRPVERPEPRPRADFATTIVRTGRSARPLPYDHSPADDDEQGDHRPTARPTRRTAPRISPRPMRCASFLAPTRPSSCKSVIISGQLVGP